MTRKTNARIAGFTFLVYILVGIAGMVLFGWATAGDGALAKLGSIAQHAPELRIVVVFSLSTCFAALLLGVSLYSITRETDPDLAMLAMICRVAEGVVGAIFILSMVGLLWLGTATAGNARFSDGEQALAAFLFKILGWNPIIGATFFAVGSTLFSWLLLRGRMVPRALAWLGIIASVLLVLILPVQLAGALGGPVVQLIWLPMLLFEVTLALWLIIKGVARPGGRQPA